MAVDTTAPSCSDLTAFQRDILAVMAREGPEYGLAIKRAVEEARAEDIHHGRLYPNLDELVEMDLVEKSTRDRRTNEYALTTDGKGELRVYQNWLRNCLEESHD